jgi:hypothetical protein
VYGISPHRSEEELVDSRKRQVTPGPRFAAYLSRRRLLGALAALAALPPLRLAATPRPANGWVLRKGDR